MESEENDSLPAKRSRFSLKHYLTDRELSPEERRSVLEDLFVFGKDNQIPFFIRMSVLLVLSTMIATAGLLSDSAAVVIGAMLVAPMMTPVLAAAGAVVMGWPARFYKSLWLVAAMGAGALLLSSALTLLSPELVFIPEQVMARTRPTYYDLLIALAAGAAGAYTITRKETSAIPGVAVAVALLPPLCAAGILFTTGEGELGVRAVVLFLTNLVAMVLSGALAFIAVGVAPIKARQRSASFVKAKIWLFLLLTLALCVPLWFYSEKILFNAQYIAAKSEILQNWLKKNNLELVDVDIFKERRTLVLELQGPSPPVNISDLYQAIHQRISETHQLEPFAIEYTWTQKVTGSWPLKENSMENIARDVDALVNQMTRGEWLWTGTQYGSGEGVSPDAKANYTVSMDHKGDLEVISDCGKWKGEIVVAGQSTQVTMKRNLFSKCRKDQALQLFVGDLVTAREAFIQDDQLRLSLQGDSGIMYFKRK